MLHLFSESIAYNEYLMLAYINNEFYRYIKKEMNYLYCCISYRTHIFSDLAEYIEHVAVEVSDGGGGVGL